MTVLADLHMHSTASDGLCSPSEVVSRAKEAGLEVIALTDHDTVDGVREAVQAGRELGVKVIRGIELGAKEYRNLHILGYNFSQEAPTLKKLCDRLLASRNERKYRIIDYLKERGVYISLEEVEALAGGDVIARPHFAQVMMEHGYVASVREAFDRYLDTDEFQKIERFKADAETCIAAIHADGGKVSMAHPYQVKLDNDQLEALVHRLADYGLDALECYYPQHTPEQQAFYLQLTEKYGLHVTGGNDFHGERIRPENRMIPLVQDLDWLF